MSNRENARERLRAVLLSDKAAVPEDFSEMIRSRIEEVLSDYMDVVPGTLTVNIEADGGEYILEAELRADRIKNVGHFAQRR